MDILSTWHCGVVTHKGYDCFCTFIPVRMFSCCQLDCTSNVDYVSLILVRKIFNNYSQQGKTQWILEYITNHGNHRYEIKRQSY